MADHPFGPSVSGPSTPADRAAQTLADAILDAPEPTGHRSPREAFRAARNAACAEPMARKMFVLDKPEAWTALVDAEAARCAYLSIGDEVRETWRARAKRVRKWSFSRGQRLLDDLYLCRSARPRRRAA